MPSTARTAPTWRWKMIPCVSGKCIFRAETSSRLRPVSKAAVERPRSMKASLSGAVGVTAILPVLTGLGRCRGWRSRLAGVLDALHLGRTIRDLSLHDLDVVE